jgi:branched-chain amino acid transport system substrate-binding protein
MTRQTENFVRMQFLTTCFRAIALFASVIAVSSEPAFAQKKYDTGVTDTEIKIGNIMPYSGPASAYGIIGRTMSAYMKMINDNGGVNGRKINFISYDDAYSPPKTVEQARKLVESDEVFLIFAPLGTASNGAIQKYMNTMKVPQLFVATGASRWGDPEHFPGRSAGSRITAPKRGYTPPISWSTMRMQKWACSTKTTTSAKTTCWDLRTYSVTNTPR